MKIEEAIKQAHFKDEFEKADINLLYTANWMNSSLQQLLKPFDISLQQFNILRILKGQKSKPAPLKLLTDRMMDKMSNTSRLVEKMLKKKLLDRKICPENRRQVEIIISPNGLNTCDQITALVNGYRLEHLQITKDEALELNRILDKMRSEV